MNFNLIHSKMGRGLHCTPSERKLILKWHSEGKSQREIAKIVGASRCMVQNALKMQKTVENRGPKRKTTSQTDRRIGHVSKCDPFKSSTTIKQELQLAISTRTIRRRLQEQSLHGRVARKVPLLSAKNIRNRIDFAKQHLDWAGSNGIKKWRNILWSDETKMNLFGSDGRTYVRRPPGREFLPAYTKKTVKHGGGCIMLWGCFSWYGVGPIYWIKQIMDQHEYTNILETVMHTYAEENMPLKWVFQQDNDPKHTSRKAKQFFVNNSIHVLPWPSQSPDLNPIENLWKDLKTAVSAYKTKNKQELWEAVQKEWAAIPVERCQRLVESMPRRCSAVMKSKGCATKY